MTSLPHKNVTPSERSASEAETSSFDSYHNDPKAEIILLSSDHVSFRVSAFYMKRESDFIRGLLEFPSSESIETAPIQLNQEAEHVRAFIDIVYSSSPIYTGWPATRYRSLLEICAQLQAEAFEKELWRIITARLDDAKAIGIPAWEAFKVGAMMNDPKLCERAVLAFESHGVTYDSICEQPSERYEEVPSQYLATLFVGNHYFSCVRGHELYRRMDWNGIAAKFGKMKST